ncbi:MAG: hypothetical protein AAF629_05905 [Chloroflexota bacterium]
MATNTPTGQALILTQTTSMSIATATRMPDAVIEDSSTLTDTPEIIPIATAPLMAITDTSVLLQAIEPLSRPQTSPLISPTTISPPTNTSIASPYFFEEDFSSISGLSQNWDVYQNDGRIVQSAEGIRLEQSIDNQYPFLIARNNPFPENGDFKVEISFRYGSLTAYGTGIAISACCEENAQTFPSLDEIFPNILFALWQDSIEGMTVLKRNYGAVFEYHHFLGKGNSSLQARQIVITYRDVDSNVTVFVDGYEITTITATQRPNQIWIGNPYIVEKPGEWTILEIESIRVIKQ